MKKLNESQIKRISYFYKHIADCVRVNSNGDIIVIDHFAKDFDSTIFSQYINLSDTKKKFLRKFTDKNNIESLISEFILELNDIISNLGNDNYSDEEKILNYLEYIRLCGMYENIANFDEYKDMFGNSIVSKISQTPLNIILLGKGVCASQAKALEYLINFSNIDEFDKCSEFSIIIGGEMHSIVGAEIIKNEPETLTTFDPTTYLGTLESLQYGFNHSKIQCAISNEYFKVDENQIKKSRETVLKYLVNKYDIKNLLSQIKGFENASVSSKVNLIENYIMKNTVVDNLLEFGSICLKDKEIENGKMFEIMCFAAGIPVDFICKDKKSETVYYVKCGDQIKEIDFKEKYNLAKEQLNEKIKLK